MCVIEAYIGGKGSLGAGYNVLKPYYGSDMGVFCTELLP